MIPDLLFFTHDLRAILRARVLDVRSTIASCPIENIKNNSVEDLVSLYKEQFEMLPLILHEDRISVKSDEVDIDVSQDVSRFIPDRSRTFLLRGTRITYLVPFTGDPRLFYVKPSETDFNPPRCEISKNEVMIQIQGIDLDPDKLKNEFTRVFTSLKKYVGWVNKDLDDYNTPLEQQIRELLNNRRSKIQQDEALIGSLEFPIKQQLDQKGTYSVPIKNKSIIPQYVLNKATNIPEPVLDIEVYEEILAIITRMTLVMERNPKTFESLVEEAIRDHFLVQLNGHFSGEATGETFNHQGKTDIMIRHKDKNIFIAECKFWRGEKLLLETVDQLLGYTSWRDTKTAIILFNRNMNFSKVLSDIPKIMAKHDNFIRVEPIHGESNSRYIFHHNNDPERKLILSVLAFNIPQII